MKKICEFLIPATLAEIENWKNIGEVSCLNLMEVQNKSEIQKSGLSILRSWSPKAKNRKPEIRKRKSEDRGFGIRGFGRGFDRDPYRQPRLAYTPLDV